MTASRDPYHYPWSGVVAKTPSSEAVDFGASQVGVAYETKRVAGRGVRSLRHTFPPYFDPLLRAGASEPAARYGPPVPRWPATDGLLVGVRPGIGC